MKLDLFKGFNEITKETRQRSKKEREIILHLLDNFTCTCLPIASKRTYLIQTKYNYNWEILITIIDKFKLGRLDKYKYLYKVAKKTCASNKINTFIVSEKVLFKLIYAIRYHYFNIRNNITQTDMQKIIEITNFLEVISLQKDYTNETRGIVIIENFEEINI